MEHVQDSGPSMHGSFAYLDQPSCSWKMSELSLFAGLTAYSGTWPPSGMMRRGTVWERVASAHRTGESACSSSPFATETANQLAPSMQKHMIWPTPMASTPNDGETPRTWIDRWIRNVTKTTGATNAGVPLAIAATAPIVQEVARPGTLERARDLLVRSAEDPAMTTPGRMNPRWVEWLMGFPVGWTSSGPSETP